MLKKTYSTTEIFARFLAKQITYYVAEREGMLEDIEHGKKAKISEVWQDLATEFDEIIKQQKIQGNYYNDNGGSIFTEYKNLRDTFVPKGSNIMDQIALNFSSSMNKEDFLNTAQGVVEQWQASFGREMKK